ncbi:YdcF family protein [Clostridium vitabionis]|uniref:YdcF family protein n=1 Tax=Clostridium vitabionis TaxID=2784388 RepID=UPI00188AF475|nr:YdcF family protein [Clostridium vitabionis]
MIFLMEALALFSLLYFIVLFFYSGPMTSMLFAWLLFAAACFLFSLWLRFLRRRRASLRIRVMSVTAVMTVFAVIGAAVFVIAGTAALSTDRDADYCIVLGARVRGRKPSVSLKHRIDRAIRYADEHPEAVMVLSGGVGEGEEISEARAIYDALLAAGIPAARMVLEDHSGNTQENISMSRNVIEQCEFDRSRQAMRMAALDRMYLPEDMQRELPESGNLKAREPSVAVLSSSFHLFRALAIARKAGFAEISGIAASTDPVMAVHLWLRETAAVLYGKFMGRL